MYKEHVIIGGDVKRTSPSFIPKTAIWQDVFANRVNAATRIKYSLTLELTH